MQRNTASRSIDKTFRQSANVISSSGCSGDIAALVTRISNLPNASNVCLTTSSAPCSVEMSAVNDKDLRPSPSICDFVAEQSDTSTAAMSAPSAAIATL